MDLRKPRHRDTAAWLFNTVIRKSTDGATTDRGFVLLHSEVLRRVLLARLSPEYLTLLLTPVTLKTSPYLVNVQSMGYHLAGRFDGDKCKVVPAGVPLGNPEDQSRVGTDASATRAGPAAPWLPIHWTLKDMMRMLTIDDEVDAELDRLPSNAGLGPSRCGLATSAAMNTILAWGRPGVVSPRLRALKRKLQPLSSPDGEAIGGVDIRCTQPGLLVMLAIHSKEGAKLQSSVQGYLRRVLDAMKTGGLDESEGTGIPEMLSAGVSGVCTTIRVRIWTALRSWF